MNWLYPFLMFHCSSPFLITGWYFREKKTYFGKLMSWLNTYVCTAGNRLTFNRWRTKDMMVSNHNPKGKWGGSSTWDVSGTEPQASAKFPIKDLTIALSLHEPCFKHKQQKTEVFHPHRSPYNLKRKKKKKERKNRTRQKVFLLQLSNQCQEKGSPCPNLA